jgi:hypothetical protein
MRWKSIYILLFVVSALLLSACDNATDPAPPVTGCDDGSGEIFPSYMFGEGKLSMDGKTLAYMPYNSGTLYLLEIAEEKQNELPKLALPDNIRPWLIYGFHWCPYDPNLLLVDMLTRTDTVGDGIKYVTGQNTYIIRTDGTVVQRVTLNKYPSWGAPMLDYLTTAWLPGSGPQADSLLVGSSIYIPQNEKTVNALYRPLAVSSSGQYWCGYSDEYPQDVIKLNGRRIHFVGFDGILTGAWYGELETYASFSPSGKYLALSGPSSTQIYSPDTPNLWIIDAEQFLANPSEAAPLVLSINFRQQYCKYTQLADPVFITDSTLAVSMLSSTDPVSHYFEISLDGTLIRQLSQPL